MANGVNLRQRLKIIESLDIDTNNQNSTEINRL
jgi:hypothetical protein